MSQVLPVDTVSEERRKPWILHMLNVNTMNFCGFALCPLDMGTKAKELGKEGEELEEKKAEQQESLIAVPNTLTSESVSILLHLHEIQKQTNNPRSTSSISHLFTVFTISPLQAQTNLA